MTTIDADPADVIGICFHGIGTPAAGLEEGAEEYFVSKDLFLAVLDDVQGRPEVDLTFDDGYSSDLETALPALQERGLSARFFPLAGRLGAPGYLSAPDVKVIASAGMIIGSHGMQHRSWRGLDAADLTEELDTAREVLSDAAGTAVRTAACPFGSYDRAVLRALRHRGYQRVFTSDRRRAHRHAWLQPRYSVRRDDTPESVRSAILRPPGLRQQARGVVAGRLKAWR
jgi:peptidoglycan/xylan/chitin deacetylase (PgdA/CDA1 family)